MDDAFTQQVLVEALKLIFLLAFPLVVALFVVGILAGAFQSATLIHDPVIGYSARLAVVIVTLYFTVPAFTRALLDLCMLIYR